jgi:hypothetical protein
VINELAGRQDDNAPVRRGGSSWTSAILPSCKTNPILPPEERRSIVPAYRIDRVKRSPAGSQQE